MGQPVGDMAEKDVHVYVRLIEFALQQQVASALHLTIPEMMRVDLMGHFPALTHDVLHHMANGETHIVVHLVMGEVSQ